MDYLLTWTGLDGIGLDSSIKVLGWPRLCLICSDLDLSIHGYVWERLIYWTTAGFRCPILYILYLTGLGEEGGDGGVYIDG